jgi:hypothetical protein
MSLSRRSFLTRTAGAVAAAAAAPLWIQHAPRVTEALPLGTHQLGAQGYQYVRVQAGEDIRVGEFVAIDPQYRATRIRQGDAGRVGAATSDINPGRSGWVMVSGQTEAYVVNYPWVARDHEIHGVATLS